MATVSYQLRANEAYGETIIRSTANLTAKREILLVAKWLTSDPIVVVATTIGGQFV
ncbi:hypothetical protein FD28_GL001592 [Levilactobacillus hammesii DSM 16381]|uniref:Uncharacterized protein n=1 Tax=Levilactobacillus hammesii DSM 16381 TaxID=1423753 RepID=A0A0R1UP12_9LACO|nr:hypothetical protein FD28_GL001592 [Levilactobacillus hammesii DSM 16381]